MEKRLMMFLVGLFLFVGSALAQTNVSGTVTSSEDGQPIVGAAVKVEGTNTGTVTDVNGHFRLNAPAGAKLTISYLGMMPQTVKAGSNMNVVLQSDDKTLNEVVVTGYGSAKKLGSVVGAVGTVGSEKLDHVVTPNFTDALAGQVSGLSVLSESGDPSQSATIRLRGVNSINSSNTPLFILDGAPISSTLFSTLNPGDIANITVLKDAASTAVYGSRAANGVIVITSKQGKYNEKAQLTLRAQYGISSPVSDGADMMNSEQYIKFRDLIGQPVSDEVKNLVSKYGFNTNWRDEILDSSAPTYDLDATLQGGGQTMNYYLGYNYHYQDGLIDHSGMNRYTLTSRINARLNQYFKVGMNTILGVHSYDQNAEWAADGIYSSNPMTAARQALPYDVPNYYTFDDKGNIVWGDRAAALKYSGIEMPWHVNAYRQRNQKNVTLNSNINETLTPFDGLTITAQQAVYAFDRTVSDAWLPHADITTPMGTPITAQEGSTQEFFQRAYNFTLTHTAEYKHNFGPHYLGLLFGEETRINRSKSFGVMTSGQSDIRQLRLTDGTTVAIRNLSDSRSRIVYNSVFGTLDYNYAEKYYLYFSLRSDGSSQFAPGHRWGTFWSIGTRWNAKREAFLKDVDWLDELGLSVNYGITGNSSGAGAYDYFGLFGTGSLYNGQSSLGISQPSNESLTWEKVGKFNVGLDFRVFNRLSMDANFYRNKTTDMLMDIPYSYTTGYGSGTGNIGAMTNTGFELTANVDILKTKDFLWTFTANVGYNKNKITELFAGRDSYVFAKSGLKLQVGKPYREFYMVRYAGVDSRTGEPMWYDKDGNLTKTFNEERDAVFTGKQQYAPWMGGFGTSFQWKGLAVSADFTWQSGKYLLSNDDWFIENTRFATSYNQTTRMLNVWTTPGQVTDIPAYGYSLQIDDHLLKNASFLRLKNLTIQYSLPRAWMNRVPVLQGARVFGIARNLFTITSFKGYDPEPDVNVVAFNYPNSRQFVMGLELTF